MKSPFWSMVKGKLGGPDHKRTTFRSGIYFIYEQFGKLDMKYRFSALSEIPWPRFSIICYKEQFFRFQHYLCYWMYLSFQLWPQKQNYGSFWVHNKIQNFEILKFSQNLIERFKCAPDLRSKKDKSTSYMYLSALFILLYRI